MNMIHRLRYIGLFIFIFAIFPNKVGAFTSKKKSTNSEKSQFILEPAISYSMGVLKQSGVNDIGTQSVQFEARLGYRISKFDMGLSYAFGSGTAEQSGIKEDYKPIDLSLFGMMRIPLSLKLSIGYAFSAKTKINSKSNPADFSGSGFRFGLAYTDLPYVSLMIEQIQRTYTKYDGNTLTNSLNDSTTAFSIGIPLFN